MKKAIYWAVVIPALPVRIVLLVAEDLGQRLDRGVDRLRLWAWPERRFGLPRKR